ncbi:hypothetical protein ACJX0J_030470, partial [Zea mays]
LHMFPVLNKFFLPVFLCLSKRVQEIHNKEDAEMKVALLVYRKNTNNYYNKLISLNYLYCLD